MSVIYKDLLGYTKDYNSLQEIAGVYKGLQGISEAHEFTRDYNGIQGFTGDYRNI